MTSGVYERTPETRASLSKSKTGKNNPMYGKNFTPEHRATMSVASRNSDAVKAANAAKRGVPLSPARCAAIQKGQEESGMFDIQRGGNDLNNHHYIYDHNDLSLNTVRITRSDHARLHALLEKLGYKVPHINLQ